MTFVNKVPRRVEDLFELAPGDNNTAMEAVLEDGTQLYLCDGYAMNYPSPWPLYYVLRLATPEVEAWLASSFVQAREFVARVSPRQLEDRSDIWSDPDSYFRGYMRIGGLELGTTPAIGFRVSIPQSWGPNSEETFDHLFDSPIVTFNPLQELPESYPNPDAP